MPDRVAGFMLERVISSYLLCHRHAPEECPVAFAAWKGFSSPLRRRVTFASCATGGHEVWWTVEATDPEAALALLPPCVATRTAAIAVREVVIP
ncbi:MAG: hypothetical protein ACRDJ4_13015 [Actinomycetota bacterium]